MSANNRKIGLRYAKAYVRAVSSAEALKSDLVILEELDKAISHDVGLKAFFKNPIIETQKKIDLLDSLLSELKSSKELVKFLNAILQNNRFYSLSEIVESLRALSLDQMGVVLVEISSSRALDDSEKKDIESMLQSKLNRTLSLVWNVNAGLLGGIVISYEGVVIDASLLGRLKSMEKSLVA